LSFVYGTTKGDMEKTVRRLKVTDPWAVQTTLAAVLQHIKENTNSPSDESSGLPQRLSEELTIP
jgi:hypothetical protein